jgi:para-nitrobenzyl esterase
VAITAAVALTLGITAISTAAVQSNGQSDGTIVRTDKGLVRGVTEGPSTVFQGIPYAAPPVGARRFTMPTPAEAWSGVRDAGKPGAFCAQLNVEGTGLLPGSSEDCLYLNVTTPGSTGEPRPVMLWIHGGGWTSGNGSDYDGKWLSQAGDVVVVSINYRLAALGFFGYPGLTNSGTFGLADQQEAMRWVQRNARAFGGDPNNVTVLGESAGGLSTCAQIASPIARPMMDRAIVESGSCEMNYPPNGNYPDGPAKVWWAPRSEIQAKGKAAGTALGCSDLACLRKLDTFAMLKTDDGFTTAGYGTPLLPIEPRKALKIGFFNRVPVMEGNTRDEQGYFGWLYELGGTMTPASYRENLVKSFGAKAAAVEKEYPLSAYDSPIHAWNAVTTDRGWVCPSVTSSTSMARHTPVYTFSFADRTAPPYVYFPAGYVPQAYHSSELPYLFNFGTLAPLNPAQTALSKQMLKYWTNFARSGNPNGPGLPKWDRFHGPTGATTQSLQLGGISQVNVQQLHHCGFWNQAAG